MGGYQPYQEYQDSGVPNLGAIPDHWSVKPLKSLCTYNDEVLSESTAPDFAIEYVDISSVSAAEGIRETVPMIFGAAPSRARRIVRDGDVLVSTVRTYLEAIARVKSPPGNLIASTGFAVIRAKQSSLARRFAGYALRSRYFIDEVVSRSVGVSYPAINASDLVSIKLAIPMLEEQQVIAAFLDHETAKIDRLIAKQERLIELLKEKRQAVISHAVTKGLNPDAPMKDSGVEWLGEVPVHWGVMKASYIGRLFGSESVPEEMVVEEGELPFLKVGSLSSGSLEVGAWNWYVDASISASCRPKSHFIVFPKRGAVIFLNKVNVVEKPALIDPNLMGWKIRSDSNARYFAHLLQARGLDELADVSTVPQINNKHIAPEKFPVPPFTEQDAIVDYLDNELKKFSHLIERASIAISLLHEHRTALISAAVTGKIDVRSWQKPRTKPEEAATAASA